MMQVESPILENKNAKYEHILLQVKALWQNESNLIANMSNLCALIKTHFDWHWVGCYLVDQQNNNLVLGPFQGPLACTRIAYGKGVCGTAWLQKETLIVPNVHEFPGHIACSAASNSEIVLPIFDSLNNVIGVFDIDSVNFNSFDKIDANFLALILKELMKSTD